MKVTLETQEHGTCYLMMSNRLYLNLEGDVDEIIAGYAFAKWKNIFFDSLQEQFQYHLLFNDKRIRLHITNDDFIELDISKAKMIDADLVVLTHINKGEVDFVGYAKVADIYMMDNVAIDGDKKVVKITEDKLIKFKEDVG
jgi:hypothetical protein